MSSHNTREAFLYLDSVRGLAAIVVVASHLVIGFYPSIYNSVMPPWIRVWYSGEFAVQLFFTLSGFVLSLSFVRGAGIESLRSAALRRYFRLVLPIATSVFLSYLLLRFGLYFNHEVAVETNQPADSWMGRWYGFSASPLRAIDEGFYRAFFAHDMGRTYNNVLWTMQMEFAGSLFVFSFLALFGKLRNRWLVYIAVGAVITRQGWV